MVERRTSSEGQGSKELLGQGKAGLQARLLVGDLTGQISHAVLESKITDVKVRGIEAVDVSTYKKGSEVERETHWKNEKYQGMGYEQKMDKWRTGMDSYLEKIREEDPQGKTFLEKLQITNAQKLYDDFLTGESNIKEFISHIEKTTDANDMRDEKNVKLIKTLGIAFGHNSSEVIEDMIKGIKNAKEDPQQFTHEAKKTINTDDTINNPIVTNMRSFNNIPHPRRQPYTSAEPKDTSPSIPPTPVDPGEIAVFNGKTTGSEPLQQNAEDLPLVEKSIIDGVVGFSEAQGGRPTMEDAHVIEENFGGKSNQAFFAVYDGHGGKEVADLAKNRLHNIVLEQLNNAIDPQEALRKAYTQTDEEVGDKEGGATAVTAFLKGDNLYVANSGDARAVLARGESALRLSYDHKASDPAEKERLEKVGAWVKNNRVMGMTKDEKLIELAVSRSIGDKNYGERVTAEPAIKELSLQKGDFKLILACDGLWDYLSDQEAVDLIKDETDAKKASDLLRDTVLEKVRKKKEELGIDRPMGDNITVIVVNLKP